MLFKALVKTEELKLGGQTYTVRYFEAMTLRGAQRFSAELVLGPADRIIIDTDTLSGLELRVARLVPATLYSRILAARAA